jgi:hypothetical protein
METTRKRIEQEVLADPCRALLLAEETGGNVFWDLFRLERPAFPLMNWLRDMEEERVLPEERIRQRVTRESRWDVQVILRDELDPWVGAGVLEAVSDA